MYDTRVFKMARAAGSLGGGGAGGVTRILVKDCAQAGKVLITIPLHVPREQYLSTATGQQEPLR